MSRQCETPRSRYRRALLRAPLAAAAGLIAAPAMARRERGDARRPLRLQETRVNGTRYYEAPQVYARLQREEPLVLRREPDNPYDARAIEVFTRDGAKLGYVPQFDNPPYAALMDAGFAVEAQVLAAPRHWYDIEIVLSARL